LRLGQGFGIAGGTRSVWDGYMLVLVDHALVLLEIPKCASTAIRRMLEPQITTPWARQKTRERHIGLRQYRRVWAEPLAQDLGRPAETICVVRDPMERAESWYRYRQRPQVAGKPVSTRGMSFAAFLTDCLSEEPPPHARIGNQARFAGAVQGRPGVDHVFDFRRLDLLVGFLTERMGVPLALEPHNVSPAASALEPLPDALLKRFRMERADEIALYEMVSATGSLHRP
jgi:hypothetical protein